MRFGSTAISLPQPAALEAATPKLAHRGAARGAKPHAPLRRHRRRRRRHVRRAAGGDRRPDRPNGAGKTTVFNLVTRLYSPDGGDIGSRRRASCGSRRTRSSAGASRARSRTSRSSLDDGARERPRRLARPRRPAAEDARRALSLLEYVGLADVAHREAGSLPYGLQKRVEAARALTSDPEAAAARRAGRRALPRGGRVPRRLRPPHEERLLAHRARRRAPHAVRDGHLRPRARARLRPADRERHAGRSAVGSRRHRGLPRHGGRRGRSA